MYLQSFGKGKLSIKVQLSLVSMYVHVYKITNSNPSREMSELMKQYSRTKLRMLYVIK